MNINGSDENLVTDQMIMNRIYVIRGKKVMIDADLASLYQMETRRLRTMMSKNAGRFPRDFMFQLGLEDFYSLKQQDSSVMRKAGTKSLPIAFTEQGLSMLAGLMKSERSIVVNIRIIRIFTMIRQILPDYPELSKIIDEFKNDLTCRK